MKAKVALIGLLFFSQAIFANQENIISKTLTKRCVFGNRNVCNQTFNLVYVIAKRCNLGFDSGMRGKMMHIELEGTEAAWRCYSSSLNSIY
ncbi:MAG: hypothetical protein NDI61_07585 [Bdellovibrionaceae bacterium]|nr:hypothetical protein [Pseudobdellovibrionaceae bacterium]